MAIKRHYRSAGKIGRTFLTPIVCTIRYTVFFSQPHHLQQPFTVLEDKGRRLLVGLPAQFGETMRGNVVAIRISAAGKNCKKKETRGNNDMRSSYCNYDIVTNRPMRNRCLIVYIVISILAFRAHRRNFRRVELLSKKRAKQLF